MATKYWKRAANGIYSTTTNWSLTSGGTVSSTAPAAGDDLVFDQSGTYTVTINAASALASITVSISGTITFNMTNGAFNIGSNTSHIGLVINSGTVIINSTVAGAVLAMQYGTDIVNYDTLTINQNVSGSSPLLTGGLLNYGTMTINLASANSLTFGSFGTFNQIFWGNMSTNAQLLYWNSASKTYQLIDNINLSSTSTCRLTNGTLDLNGYTITTGFFNANSAGNLTFNGGNLVLTGAGTAFNCNGASFTTSLGSNFNSNGIQMSGSAAQTFAGNSLTYNCALILNSSYAITISGNNTFYQFFCNLTSGALVSITGSNTIQSVLSPLVGTLNLTAGTTQIFNGTAAAGTNAGNGSTAFWNNYYWGSGLGTIKSATSGTQASISNGTSSSPGISDAIAFKDISFLPNVTNSGNRGYSWYMGGTNNGNVTGALFNGGDTSLQVYTISNTSTTSWTTPSSWNPFNNTIYLFGAGGGGGGSTNATVHYAGGGGGGGGYKVVYNYFAQPGTSITVSVGTGGSGGAANADGGSGGSTTWASGAYVAGGGGGGNRGYGGSGGAGGTGDYSGGSGSGGVVTANTIGIGGGGGGGAGGPNGNGGNGGYGGYASAGSGGGGGGGNGGGGNGANGGTNIGGAGGNNSSGVGGGAQNTEGVLGGGGGGGSTSGSVGKIGGIGVDIYGAIGGAGGSGGSGSSLASADIAGNVGGGGGAGGHISNTGSTYGGGAGGSGLIVIAYTYASYGTLFSTYCVGTDQWGVYANGAGGTYNQVILTNSPSCGFKPNNMLSMF